MIIKKVILLKEVANELPGAYFFFFSQLLFFPVNSDGFFLDIMMHNMMIQGEHIWREFD